MINLLASLLLFVTKDLNLRYLGRINGFQVQGALNLLCTSNSKIEN